MWIECHPKYKEITEEEYIAAGKKYAPKTYDKDFRATTLDEMKDLWDEVAFYSWYEKRAIYPEGVGIMAQINNTAKPIGYKYYKRIGTEPILFHGTDDIPLLKELGLIK